MGHPIKGGERVTELLGLKERGLDSRRCYEEE
jgi:hypothetical protein